MFYYWLLLTRAARGHTRILDHTAAMASGALRVISQPHLSASHGRTAIAYTTPGRGRSRAINHQGQERNFLVVHTGPAARGGPTSRGAAWTARWPPAGPKNAASPPGQGDCIASPLALCCVTDCQERSLLACVPASESREDVVLRRQLRVRLRLRRVRSLRRAPLSSPVCTHGFVRSFGCSCVLAVCIASAPVLIPV